MSNEKLEKITNDKLEKLSDEEIVEVMYELLQKHPEIDIPMIHNKIIFYYGGEAKHVSKKRLKKLIGAINFGDVTRLHVGKNWTLTVGRIPTDSQKEFKNMPVQNRLAYLKKYSNIFSEIWIDLMRLSWHQNIFEQVNNSFTDEEKLAAEVLKKPIPNYLSTIEQVNDIMPTH